MKTKKRWVSGVLLGLGSMIVLAAQLPAQVNNGSRFEVSASGSIWNMRPTYGDTAMNFNLPLRFGFYAFKGLEFEPELFLVVPRSVPGEPRQTTVLPFGNLAYNLQISRSIMIFALGGVGMAEGARLGSDAIPHKKSVLARDFGTGLKTMISDSAAARLEYRFIGYSPMENTVRNDHMILVGLSVFF